MATQLAVDFNGLGNALRLSLDNWGRSDPKYGALYKTLPREVLAIAFAALSEMKLLKPGAWEVWWATEHNRFIREKGVKQRELLLLHEIMYHFLTALSRGQLGNGSGKDSDGKAKRKTKAEPGQ